MSNKTQLLVGTAALLLALCASAADKPPFPRLAGVNNGSPHNYDDPAYQKQLARLDFSVIAIWVGWDKTYGMTPEQYREKWGLPVDYPMVAPNYAKARSALAKEMGLGQKRGR